MKIREYNMNIVERTKNKWNKKADECNQWHTLDLDEILTLIAEEDVVNSLLCAGWRSIKDDTAYKKEPRVFVFSPQYPKGSEMRIRILDAQFVHILTDATHWKKLDEPTGI